MKKLLLAFLVIFSSHSAFAGGMDGKVVSLPESIKVKNSKGEIIQYTLSKNLVGGRFSLYQDQNNVGHMAINGTKCMVPYIGELVEGFKLSVKLDDEIHVNKEDEGKPVTIGVEASSDTVLTQVWGSCSSNIIEDEISISSGDRK